MKTILLSALASTALMAGSRPVLGGDFYFGALGGVATLSGDGRYILSGTSGQTSLYKPENGAALNVFGGWDFSQYASLQANYIWNRNDVTLVSTAFGPAGATAYQQARTSQQSSAIADLLVYFRNRKSRVRPYLSGGTGAVWLSSSVKALIAATGSPAIPPQHFSDVNIGLRVAVGMDVRLGGGWWFRYSFSETSSSNPISAELSPPGQRGLKNFQNLFGLVKRF
ncbi:MAG TPA: outer membrane beta-barrel protein [Terriglobia bacterium]|nr:outer membrane beta-barrel protein [Terriglobia bacterium]